MNRRDFVVQTALATAAIWVGEGLGKLFSVSAAAPPPILAFLADAHLKNGDPNRAEARALARAVAEIKALRPRPTLVLFAGDLAHDGHPHALALGEEILSDFDVPVLAVRGEGDGPPQKHGPGWSFFAQGLFVYGYEGVNLLGVETNWQDTPAGPAFALGEAQLRWLEGVLSGLDPDRPLLVLSHAPLMPVFPAWGQWTADSGPLLQRLARFANVTCFHGHVHQAAGLLVSQQAGADKTRPPLVGGVWGAGGTSPSPGTSLPGFTPSPVLPHQWEGSQQKAGRGLNNISLPATSWPLPSPLTGTPETLRPGLGPRGCGWALLPPGNQFPQVRQVLWQA